MAQPFWAAIDDAIPGFGYSEGGLLWNQPVLDGKILPGHWSVRVGFKRDIEVKKQKGKDGAAITDQGDSPTEIELRGEIWTDASWEEWQEVAPLLFAKKKGKERSPVKIEHPQTAAKGITDLYIKELNEELGIEDDVMVITISCIEWTPRPKEVTVKKKPINTEAIKNQTFMQAMEMVNALQDGLKQQETIDRRRAARDRELNAE